MQTLRTLVERDALILEAMPQLDKAISRATRRYGLLAQSADNLYSAACLRLTRAAATFDASRGVPWAAFAEENIRYGFLDACKAEAESKHRGVGSLDAELPGGGSLVSLRIDPKASDPGELAAARECLLRRPTTPIPDPAAIAAKARALQAAVYAAVTPADMGEVVATLLARAKAGNVQAAKAVMALANPAGTSLTVHQHNVVVASGDLS